MQGCNSTRIRPPIVKSCVVLEASQCVCTDGQRDYETDCYGYQAVSPDDYLKLRNHYQDVVKRLEICLAAPKKCQ
jgi:hypothetical protein